MSKLLIRLTVVGVAIYLVICYSIAMVFGIDICISRQGVYHCKYIKYTAYGIFLSDSIVCIDNITNAFYTPYFAFIPLTIISIGLLTTTTLALRHYHQVRKLKKQRKSPNKFR